MVVVVGLATIVGTGGSDGNGNGDDVDNGDVSPDGYTGETSQARISETNAENIAAALFNNLQNIESASDAYGPAGMSAGEIAGSPLVGGLSTGEGGEDLNGELKECSYGGKILIDETTKEEGDKTISTAYIDFMNCNQDGVTTIDGEAEAEVVLKCLDYDPELGMSIVKRIIAKRTFFDIRTKAPSSWCAKHWKGQELSL